jgi:hypothetical protein
MIQSGAKLFHKVCCPVRQIFVQVDAQFLSFHYVIHHILGEFGIAPRATGESVPNGLKNTSARRAPRSPWL